MNKKAIHHVTTLSTMRFTAKRRPSTTHTGRFQQMALTSCCLAALLTLSACGGGAAGDDGGIDIGTTPLLVEPFVGVWDISGTWGGSANDEAYMVIREVDSSTRKAEVALYDYDDAATGAGTNCFIAPLILGEAYESTDDRVFLDGISEFTDATILLTNDGSLEITYTDTLDLDGDGNKDDLVTYTANRIGTTEIDITPICE